ncbi:MAG TPA: YjbE family putative metal transport protein [Bacillota bacterium]|nr:YjbE family putative metal transport protein [Bacillota bacterium]
MHEFISIIISSFHIALLNIMLSCDSISVITLITRKLPVRFAQKAYVIGITIAVVLTIFFTSIASFIMEIQWLPVQLIGGLLLVKITIDLIKSNGYKDEIKMDDNQKENYIEFWSAVNIVILADITLSMDNVLAIAGAANGSITTIALGLLISLPFILYASQYCIIIIQKNRFVLYISGAILIYTASEMIFSHKVIATFIPHIIILIAPLLNSLLILLYGVYVMKIKFRQI